MSTAKRVIKNSLWLFGANIVLRIISAVVILLLARGLGVEAFGQYSFAISFVGFFVIFTAYGFNNLIIRDVAKNKELTSKYLNNIFTIKLVFGAISFLVLLLVSLFIGKPQALLIVIYIFGIELIVSSFAETLRNFFHAYERMELDAIAKIAEKILWSGLVLLVIFGNLTLVNVALAVLLSSILGFGINYVFLRKYIVKLRLSFDKKAWKTIIIAATPFALTGLFAMINFRIDQVMLSFLTNDVLVGTYSAAYKVIDLLGIVPSLLLASLYPVFSVAFKKDRKLFDRSFSLSIRYVVILALPIVTGVFLLANQAILIFYGSDYAQAADVLKILIFISLVSFVNTPLFVTLNAIGKQKVTMINTAATAFVNVIMNLLLIPKYGIYGAAFATIISELAFFTLSSYQLRKAGVKLNIIKKGMRPLIASVIMAIFIWQMPDLNLLILIPVAAAIYFGLLFIMREFSKDDVAMIKRMLRRRTE